MPFRALFSYLLLLLLPCVLRGQIAPIGQWRDHLPYHSAIAVAGTDDKVWCATPFSLFSLGTDDHSVDRFSKTNGLSATGITAFVANATMVVIGYTNSRVDLLDADGLFSIDAIRQSPIVGDKIIHQILIRNGLAYLATGLGIIAIDLTKKEVKDTYVIGQNGQQVAITSLSADANFLYAATQEGLKRGRINNSNLADFRNWTLVSGNNGLPAGPVDAAALFQNNLVVLHNNSLYVLQNDQWQLFYSSDQTIQHIDPAGAKLLVSEQSAVEGRVTVLSPQGMVLETIRDARYTRAPRQTIEADGYYWIADSLAGLTRYAANQFESFVPNSPRGIATGPLQVLNHSLWAAAGSVSPNWLPQGNTNGLYNLANDSWTNVNYTTLPALDSLPDLVSLTIAPIDESVWAGSFGGGLLQRQTDGRINVFKQNTGLQPADGYPGSYRVGGLAFDREQQLWIANYGARKPLVMRKKDGSWQSFFVPYAIPENAVGPLIVDDYDQKWIIAPNGNGLLCFNHGQSVDNAGDDRWKWYRNGRGNGNLPDNQVLSVASDKNGFIWIGTSRGIGIVQCPGEVFTANGCEAILPVVQQDNFAGYLFSGEQVQSIAIDGADRKWIGTKNGVWLISPDGSTTIARFTAENSPLLSNDILQIAIDGQTGEVFFATDKGICSYRSTATEGGSTNSSVLVFPNPVPPGYTGTIAIRGVVNNAIVKIAELDGRLVYQTRAQGGQAVWNGKDYRGKSISTGVYLVLISDDNKQEKAVAKIIFVQK
ncbi:two-component regulator propeller domain-containing protein [Paraflavitalea pollutisoli]|uniref:type IX secretion system anionic LPS delivery protein PorZ n=1 Tax=Paraflavitalea pollutisoli TaxID=3034143 RepID=UPI0023ECB164|nr:two-component regulator propeller domain-containing protein [Paraflavitalea sp. H1-2-19X]